MAMSYNEYLRKNPTDYKARAMGRKRWEATQGAKQKMKVGKDRKVRISTKDDPKKYPSYSEQARGESKKSTGGRGKDTQQTQYDRIRKKGQSIALESANPIYETKILSAHRVKIQGKLIGLLRKY